MIEMLNMDCMEYMATQPDNAFDLAIVDPPYGLEDWNDRGSNKNICDKQHMDLDKIKKWEKAFPYEEYFHDLFRVSKNQIVWGGNHFLDYLGKTKQIIVWDKTIRGMHFNDCEIAWCSNIKEACRIYTQTANDKNRIHPTQKPVKLYSWLLRNYAEKGQRILDTHGGSFSSAIAAHYFGVDMVICEIDEDYFKAGKERFERETKQIAMF
jgi:site-specific DNA-methyltransferase (adenine-specific)